MYVQRAVRLSAAGSFRPVPAGRSRVGARRQPRYGRRAAAAVRFVVRRTDLAHSLRRRRRARLSGRAVAVGARAGRRVGALSVRRLSVRSVGRRSTVGYACVSTVNLIESCFDLRSDEITR